MSDNMTNQVYAEVVGLVFGEHDGCQCETCTAHWRLGKANRILEVLDLEHDPRSAPFATMILDVVTKLRGRRNRVTDRDLLDQIAQFTSTTIAYRQDMRNDDEQLVVFLAELDAIYASGDAS